MSADDARRRFDEATQQHLLAPLPGGVEVRASDAAEVARVAGAWWSADARPRIDPEPLYPEALRTSLADLDAVLEAPLAHHVLLVHGGEPIGAYWGQQEIWGRYFMINTILRADWRGRGVYRAFLANVTRAATEAGFREMYSRHRADNNDVIVPKLRASWVISGFEVHLKFGLLVHLRRYLNEDLVRLHGYRVDAGHADALRAAGAKLP